MEENGEKSPWLPSKVFLRSVVHYVMESVNYDWYETGVPLTFMDSCVTNRKKRGLPGELERRKERICDDAYCAAEKDGDG